MKKLITLLIFLTYMTHSYAIPIVSLSENVHSYLSKNETLDVKKELEIKADEKIVGLKVKAQATGVNSTLKVTLNDKMIHKSKLSAMGKVVSLKFKKGVKDKLKISSNSAYVEILKANLVSDEPVDDDFSNIGKGF